MSAHLRISEPGKPFHPASKPRTEPAGRYIASAPVADVMFDQLEYLAAHAVRSCPRGCADCARLAQVKNLLLLPFLTSKRQAATSPASRKMESARASAMVVPVEN